VRKSREPRDFLAIFGHGEATSIIFRTDCCRRLRSLPLVQSAASEAKPSIMSAAAAAGKKTDKDLDPFLRSLGRLKQLLSPGTAQLGQHPIVATASAARPKKEDPRIRALQSQVEFERSQREQVEQALAALTTARQALQEQLELAEAKATDLGESLEARSETVQALESAQAQTLLRHEENVVEVEAARQQAQLAQDAAEARTASLELQVQEMQDNAQKQKAWQAQESQHYQEEKQTLLTRITNLQAELVDVRGIQLACRVYSC
jgi:chromosome segregation ATPase